MIEPDIGGPVFVHLVADAREVTVGAFIEVRGMERQSRIEIKAEALRRRSQFDWLIGRCGLSRESKGEQAGD